MNTEDNTKHPTPMMPGKIEWHDGDMPYSPQFGDHYYARQDGRAETNHVFLDGNGLPARFSALNNPIIAELGFGTGLNFLETWRQWIRHRSTGQMLTFVSFEKYPLPAQVIGRALHHWPDLKEFADRLCENWDSDCRSGFEEQLDDQTKLVVHFGDVAHTLPRQDFQADAWYLDGFAPAKNPEMWGAETLNAVAKCTGAEGTFASYTAAGWVRRNLMSAGFHVEKRKGYGKKRDMIVGHKLTLI